MKIPFMVCNQTMKIKYVLTILEIDVYRTQLCLQTVYVSGFCMA